MTNRYEAAVLEIEARIVVLHARIDKWQGKPLASRIPGVEAEIAALQKQIPTLRGTGKLVRQMYG